MLLENKNKNDADIGKMTKLKQISVRLNKRDQPRADRSFRHTAYLSNRVLFRKIASLKDKNSEGFLFRFSNIQLKSMEIHGSGHWLGSIVF